MNVEKILMDEVFKMSEIYLDNVSTTKPAKEVVEEILHTLTEIYGNPSSLHRKGIEAEKLINHARERIAKFLQVKSNEIYFTSGGTESNNLAIKGIAYAKRRLGNHLITSVIEHQSVLETFRQLEKEGFSVSYISVDSNGYLNLEELKKDMRDDTILVSIMYVNNEVGSIQPIEEISKIVTENVKTAFHVDAVQAFGKIQLISSLKGIHLLSISGHKIYGPKGIGALYVKEGTKIQPLLNGGGQERGLRAGTENIPGIAGLSRAVELLNDNFQNWTRLISKLKEHLKNRILSEIDGVILNTPEHSVPHILNLSFSGLKAEVLLHSLEKYGIFVSTKSACVSKKGQTSYVLKAMGRNDIEIEGAIRFGLSPFLTFDDIDYTVEILKKEISQLRKYKRR